MTLAPCPEQGSKFSLCIFHLLVAVRANPCITLVRLAQLFVLDPPSHCLCANLVPCTPFTPPTPAVHPLATWNSTIRLNSSLVFNFNFFYPFNGCSNQLLSVSFNARFQVSSREGKQLFGSPADNRAM